MKLSDKGAAFIAGFEGFVPHPYVDPGSGGEPITIGYGTTIYPDGRKVTMQDQPVTKVQAMGYLKYHVDSLISGWLTANLPNLSQHQFDAIASFIYNLGLGNFKTSTLLKDIKKQAECSVITKDLSMWTKAAGKVLPGLVRRRVAEGVLYCTGSYGAIGSSHLGYS
jgi:lysozyme